jgi:peptide/nickel transport system substrate-binding protein
MKRTFIFCTLLVLTIFLAGCTPSTSSKEADKNILKMATGKDDFYSCAWDGRANLYSEGLLTFDQQWNYEPLLAEKWSVSDDGKVYTFFLKKGIKFHDNTPFNAESVKYAFDTYLLKQLGPELANTSSIDIVDEYTVRITLAKPNPVFLSNLAVYKEILSPKAVEQALNEGVKAEDLVGKVFVGTGPYKFKDWQKSQEIIFVKNEDYWQGDVQIDEIVVKIIPDASTRVLSLIANEVDMLGQDMFSTIPYQELADLESQKDIQITKKQSAYSPQWFSFNIEKEPFKSPNFRKAISYAVNKQEIADAIFGKGVVPPARGPLGEGSKFYNSSLVKPEYNLAKAKQLFAEAGFVDTDGDGILEKNGKPLKCTLAIELRRDEWKKTAELLQSQLKKAGIELEIQSYEMGALREKWTAGDFDLIQQSGIGLPHDDPQMFFEVYFSSKAKMPYPSVINDQKMDELIASLSSVTGQERLSVYEQIQNRIEELTAGVFLYHYPFVAATNKRVNGFEIAPLGWHSYQDIWKVRIDH